MKTASLFFALLFVWVTATAQQHNIDPQGEFSGLVFSDFYWVAASHNDDLEGNNGMWIRRLYFTYDREINDAFSARFRLEASSEGDFLTSAKLTPVVKDLYLKWQNENHQVLAGISSTPTWGLVEDVWGYRSVEKTPLDLQGFASSRDFGISVKGELDEEGRLNYHFMVGNGNSNRSEIDKGKKFMLSLSYEITERFVVEAYGDWNDNRGNEDWLTLQGFAGYRTDDFNLGILYAYQNRANAVLNTVGSNGDLNLEVASLFTNFAIAENSKGYLRLDHSFDAIPGVHENDYFPLSNQAESTVLIGGVDFEVGPDIHIMPNIEAALYDESDLTGATPDSDLIPRLTLFYNF